MYRRAPVDEEDNSSYVLNLPDKRKVLRGTGKHPLHGGLDPAVRRRDLDGDAGTVPGLESA